MMSFFIDGSFDKVSYVVVNCMIFSVITLWSYCSYRQSVHQDARRTDIKLRLSHGRKVIELAGKSMVSSLICEKALEKQSKRLYTYMYIYIYSERFYDRCGAWVKQEGHALYLLPVIAPKKGSPATMIRKAHVISFGKWGAGRSRISICQQSVISENQSERNKNRKIALEVL